MSVKRRDLIQHFEGNGFGLLREGKKHSICTNGDKRFRSNGIEYLTGSLPTSFCRQAGIPPKF